MTASRILPILAVMVFAVSAVAGPSRAEDGESWRVYRNAVPAFTVLYPSRYTPRAVQRREGNPVQEWALPDRRGAIRLNILARPHDGGNLPDWVRARQEGPITAASVAGLQAAVQEYVFERTFTTSIVIDEPQSDRLIEFVLALHDVPEGRPIAEVKRAHRATLTEFWRMVESLKLEN